MKRSILFAVFIALIFLTLAFIPTLAAQSADRPLVVLWAVHDSPAEYGDIWIYEDGTWTRRTNWEYNHTPIISPDGQRVAYASMASVAKDALTGNERTLGEVLPINLWVLNNIARSDDGFRIADQPEEARFSHTDYENDFENSNFITRSDPVWSPDGGKLGWLELSYPNQEYSLAIYDFASEETTLHPLAIPPLDQTGRATAGQLFWGQTNLAIVLPSWDYLAFYTPQGEKLTPAPTSLYSPYLPQGWVEHEGEEVFGVDYDLAQYGLIDPLTGNHIPFTGEIRLAALGSDNPYLAFGWYLEASRQWDLHWNGNTETLTGATYHTAVAVAPQGGIFAYATNSVNLWDNGTVTKLDSPINGGAAYLAWGYGRRYTGENTQRQAVCTGLPPTRMSYGIMGRVSFTDGTPLNLRQQAGTDGELIGQIPEGTIFQIVGGPVCKNNLMWWKIHLPENNEFGYVAEADPNGVYFIEPYSE